MSANDQSLLQQWVHDRDAEAFRMLAMRHAAMVYNTSRRILRDPTDAEDVAQECFEALVRAGDKPGAYLGAWLHRVATNLSFNRLEAQRHRQGREERFAENAASATKSYDEDLYAHVDKAIAALPDKLRQPLVAHFLENQTHDAIAESIGVSRQTITYRIGQAVERVRSALKRRGVMVAAAAFSEFLLANSSEAVPSRLAANLGKLAVAGSSAASVGLSLAGMQGLVSLKAFLAAAAIVAVGGAGVFALRSEPNTTRPAIPSVPAKIAATQPKPPVEPEPKKSPAPFASAVPSRPVPQSTSNAVPPAPTKQGDPKDRRAELQSILESPVGFEFENIRLAEVLNFISESWDINLALDSRVVLSSSLPGPRTAPVVYYYVTDGMVPDLDVRDVSLGEALRTMCRPLELDFTVNNSIILISSPALLDAEGLARLNDSDDSSDPILQTATSLESGNHISKIAEFMADSLDVNITIDHRAVAPEGKACTTVNEVVEEPLQPEPPFVTDGILPYISLKDVALSDAFSALTRPLNLAYSVEDGFVWISTHERIEQEPFTPPDTSTAAPALIDALQTPQDFKFDNTSLASALATMAQRANVSIEVDAKNTSIAAATVEGYSIKALPFSTALNIILRQHDLAFVTNGQDIIVTSPARARNKNLAQWNAVPIQQLPKQ